MKFTCQKKDIVQAIQIAMKAVAPKPKTPILGGIYIKAEDNSLMLQATDNELSIICNIPAQVEIPGEIIFVGRNAQEVIRRLPGDTVEFECSGQEKMIHIKSNRSKFSFLSMEANDFPVISKLQGTSSFQVSDVILRDLILNTSFAAMQEESKPIFTGCLLELTEEKILMAATNTHRLSIKSSHLEDFHGEYRYVIPAKMLNEVQKILQSEIPRTVTVSCTHNQVSFEVEGVYISSRLIEGSFPDYHRAIPDEFQRHVVMNTNEIKNIIDRVALISRGDDYNVITMDFANSMVRISSANPEIGNGEEYASAVIDGDDLTICFNADYINDGLKLIKSEEFMLSMNGPLNATTMTSEEDPNFLYVVTPVRRQK